MAGLGDPLHVSKPNGYETADSSEKDTGNARLSDADSGTFMKHGATLDRQSAERCPSLR